MRQRAIARTHSCAHIHIYTGAFWKKWEKRRLAKERFAYEAKRWENGAEKERRKKKLAKKGKGVRWRHHHYEALVVRGITRFFVRLYWNHFVAEFTIWLNIVAAFKLAYDLLLSNENAFMVGRK